MSTLDEKYKIKERAEVAVKKHGSIEKAINYLQSELNGFEDLWNAYSCDCLGHGITCNRLLVSWLRKSGL